MLYGKSNRGYGLMLSSPIADLRNWSKIYAGGSGYAGLGGLGDPSTLSLEKYFGGIFGPAKEPTANSDPNVLDLTGYFGGFYTNAATGNTIGDTKSPYNKGTQPDKPKGFMDWINQNKQFSMAAIFAIGLFAIAGGRRR